MKLKQENNQAKLEIEIEEVDKFRIKIDIFSNEKNKITRTCEICNVEVYRTSYAKDIRGKRHIENWRKIDKNIPEWLFEETIENKKKKIYNPKSLEQLAREKRKIDDEELAKKLFKPYIFTNRALQIGLNITLDIHHKNVSNLEKTMIPNFPEIGIELQYIKKVLDDMTKI